MTVIESPPTAAAHDPVSAPPAPASGAPAAVSAPAGFVSDPPKWNPIKAADTPGEATPRRPLTASQKWAAAGIIVAALALAGDGLYLSFDHVANFAYERLHFGTLRKGRMFAVGVDTGIMVMIAVDLLMAWLKRPINWIRYPVWLLTAATVVLNAASGAPQGRAWQLMDYVAAGAHGVVPVLFVMVVEVGRTSIDRVVRPGEQAGRDWIPWDRWLLAPLSTGKMYRRMRLYGITSYPEMTRREQELLGYEQWLNRKYKGDLSQATDDELLPMKMAPYGYTVSQALTLPEQQEREAEKRAEEAERRRLDAETRRELAQKRAETERLEAQGALDATRVRVEGEVGQARAHARAQVSAAERAAQAEEEALETALLAEAKARTVQAQREEAEHRKAQAAADLAAAELEEQAAQKRKEITQAEWAAADEARAIETQAAAEARRATAEADRAAAEIERAAAETQAATVEAHRKAASEEAARQEALADIKRSQQAAAEAALAAAETRAAAAEIETRAVEMEDAAKLTSRQRAVRKVARMALTRTGGDPMQLQLADIQRELQVTSPSTASEYRQEAVALLADGYRP